MLKKRLAGFALALAVVIGLVPGVAFADVDDGAGTTPAVQATMAVPISLTTQEAEYLEGIPKPEVSDISITAEKDSIHIEIQGEMSKYYLGISVSTKKGVPETAPRCPAYKGWETIKGLQPGTTYYVYVSYMSMKMTRPTAEYYGDWSDPIVVKTLADEPVLAANPMTVKPKVVKAKKGKKTVVKAKKAFAMSGAQGKVTYKVAKYDKKAKKKITVSSFGKVTVKKGLKKGTYRLKVKVTAAGNAYYNPAAKTVTLKVQVK